MFKEMKFQFPKTPIRDRVRTFVVTPASPLFVTWLLSFAIMGAVLQYQSRVAHIEFSEYARDSLEVMRYRVMLGMRDLAKVQERYYQLVDLTSMKLDGYELVTVERKGMEIHMADKTEWSKLVNGDN